MSATATHQLSFWQRYVFSTDHKVIGKQYLITGLAMALVGGLFATIMRGHLAWPADGLPGVGPLSPDAYNVLVTYHGSIMVFWVAMPILVAAFGNFLIPLMIGTDDMVFPRLNMMSYWVFLLSAIVLVISMLVPGGGAATGWTVYPPLSAQGGGYAWGVDLWLLAVALEFVAFLMGGINFIVTAINKRAPGMKAFDVPLFVWLTVIASIIFMLSVGPLIAGAVMLLLDRIVGTSFYVVSAGGDPLLFQHLFWFFGHPEVYVLLLPALGIVAEVICAGSRKTIFGYRMIVYATIIAGVLSLMVWAHHQFVAGIDPRLAAPFSLMTILISVPFAVIIFSFIATLWRGQIRYSVPMLFAVAMVAEFLMGGVTGIICGSAAADIYIHDTYFLVAHFHYTLFPIVFFAGFTGIYHWFPKATGRSLNRKLGLAHLALTVLFFNMTFLPLFNLGMMGHHRRIALPTAFDYLREGQDLQLLATVGAIGLLFAQLPFFINIVHGWFKGPPAEDNPWNVTTLEWSTASPPPHGNFAGPVSVTRGPYTYSPPKTTEDFLPQGLVELAPGSGAALTHGEAQ